MKATLSSSFVPRFFIEKKAQKEYILSDWGEVWDKICVLILLNPCSNCLNSPQLARKSYFPTSILADRDRIRTFLVLFAEPEKKKAARRKNNFF